MPRISKNKLKNANNLKKLSTYCSKRGIPDTPLSDEPVPPLKMPPRRKRSPSPNRGYSSNRQYVISPRSNESPISLFSEQKNKKGNLALILYGLSTMSRVIEAHKDISLTKASKIAMVSVSSIYGKLYSSKTLRRHYKRIQMFPEHYYAQGKVFPSQLGNHSILSPDQELSLIKVLEDRIANKQLSYPTISDFLNLTFDHIGHKYSKSWMSIFLKRKGFSYGVPRAGKNGTRYHDSPINLADRIDFLLRKIWYLSWEADKKLQLYIHDESWINEKPSGTRVWSSSKVSVSKKIEGRRFAFASLWCLNSGLLNPNQAIEDVESSIRDLKEDISLNPTLSPNDIFELADKNDILPVQGIILKNNSLMYESEEPSSSFFQFMVKTASSNKGVSLQMNSTKFLQSIELMVRGILKYHPVDQKLVIQLDNATYHRSLPESDELSKVTSEYPVSHRDGSSSIGMIGHLKSWNLRPKDTLESWWTPLSKTLRRSKKLSKRQIIKLEQEEFAINEHKSQIKWFYKTRPRVRNRKTLVDILIADLSTEFSSTLKYPISILWGARGHSELAEIEHSWNFTKGWIKSKNPRSSKETLELLRRAVVLDTVNRHSWRNRIILVIDCYIVNSYFSQGLLRKKYKKRAVILEKWNNLFAKIHHQFSFTEEGFKEFCEFFTPKIAKQLSFNEIQELLASNK